MTRPRWLLAKSAAIMLVIAFGVASPAAADADSTAPVAADVQAQERLSELIQTYADRHHLAGYAGSAMSPDGTTVTLYWAGSVPKELSAFLASVRGRTAVPVRQVTYSATEMVARARQTLAAAKAAGIPVTGAGPTTDFNGLHVDVAPQATADQRAALLALGAAEIGELTAVPLAGRLDDSSPFYGGGRIQDATGVGCTTGWAVRNRTTGVRGIVTARHCGPNTTWQTPTGTTVGTSNGGAASTDAMVITGQNYLSYAFIGAYNGVLIDRVHSLYNPQVGAAICGDGSYSGEICNSGQAHVIRANYILNGVGPGSIGYTSGAYGLAGQGDSGGPGIAHISGGLSIRGMIDQGVVGTEAPCGGVQGARTCYRQVFFVNPGTVDSSLNVVMLFDGA